MKKILFISFLLLSFLSHAQVRFARLFTDHVVLQRQKPIPVWGWASPNESLTVRLAGQSQNTQADATGKWKVTFTALEAGGPHQLIAEGKTNKITLEDVLIGEVWLCSGQSNMEWKVSGADNFYEEKKNANYHNIRHFYVEHEVHITPQTDYTKGEWKICTPDNVGDFTAVGYFFAREIAQKLNVPVGLLHASWGGSQAEGWISEESLKTNEEFKNIAQNFPKNWQEADAIYDLSLRKKIVGSAIQPTPEDEKQYLNPNFNPSKWQTINNPTAMWEWNGLYGYRGKGYMAKTIDVANEFANQSAVLSLAIQDNFNEIYLNGELISAGIMKGVRKIEIPANRLKTGNNLLMIKFDKMIEPAWYGMGMMGDAEEVYLKINDHKIKLDKDWKIMPAFAQTHEYVHGCNNNASILYNGMIAPAVSFGVRGALWYQGESNAGRAYQYRKTFPLLINDWRKKWNNDFYFYFVQLSSFGNTNDSNKGSDWAELREAQSMTLSLPKTGMAVTTDVGNQYDIHPTNKQDVGKRLAYNALKNTYNQAITPSGPVYENVKIENDKATLTFKFADKGLMVKDKYGYLKGFEVASDDKIFYFAKGNIVGSKVVIAHPKGQKIASVRYAWTNSPVEANLFNIEGLPAGTFRTDNWEGVTIGNKFE